MSGTNDEDYVAREEVASVDLIQSGSEQRCLIQTPLSGWDFIPFPKQT